MKRYAMDESCDGYEHPDGDWVRAETAQRLYEALHGIMHGKNVIMPVELCDAALEALALADEE